MILSTSSYALDSLVSGVEVRLWPGDLGDRGALPEACGEFFGDLAGDLVRGDMLDFP